MNDESRVVGAPVFTITGDTITGHVSRPDCSPQDRQMSTNQQVSFWSVHECVAPLLAAIGSWPLVGTPAWCALANDDPAKIAALFDAARHWALRVETCQQAHADASREISAAADWSVIAQQIRVGRPACYIPREVA